MLRIALVRTPALLGNQQIIDVTNKQKILERIVNDVATVSYAATTNNTQLTKVASSWL